MSLNPLTTEILLNHPKLTLEVLDALPPKEIATLIRRVPGDLALRMILPLSNWKTTQVIETLPKTTIKPVLAVASTEECLKILRKIPEKLHLKALDVLEDDKGKVIQKILAYPLEAVGAWMNPAPLSALPDNTVNEVLAELHQAKRYTSERIFIVYIVDQNNKLKGAISVSDLLQVNPDSPIRQVMQKKIKILAPYNSLALIDTYQEWQDFNSLPVIDPDMGLVGELSQTNLRRAADFIKPREEHLDVDLQSPLLGNLEAADAFVSGLVDLLPTESKKD